MTAKKAEPKREPLAYVGPTLGGGILMRNSIFRDGAIPPHIASMFKASASLRGLFVPVSELAESRRRIRIKGDILNTYVRNLQSELKGV